MALNTFGLIARHGLQVLTLLPQIIALIKETTEAIEAIGGPGTGDAKKAAVLEAIDAAFDLQQQSHQASLPVDKLAFRALSSHLVETVLTLDKAKQERAQGTAPSF